MINRCPPCVRVCRRRYQVCKYALACPWCVAIMVCSGPGSGRVVASCRLAALGALRSWSLVFCVAALATRFADDYGREGHNTVVISSVEPTPFTLVTLGGMTIKVGGSKRFMDDVSTSTNGGHAWTNAPVVAGHPLGKRWYASVIRVYDLNGTTWDRIVVVGSFYLETTNSGGSRQVFLNDVQEATVSITQGNATVDGLAWPEYSSRGGQSSKLPRPHWRSHCFQLPVRRMDQQERGVAVDTAVHFRRLLQRPGVPFVGDLWAKTFRVWRPIQLVVVDFQRRLALDDGREIVGKNDQPCTIGLPLRSHWARLSLGQDLRPRRVGHRRRIPIWLEQNVLGFICIR
jgi:hypothetical protein